MQKALESNIWKYAVYLVTNKKVYVAILSAYYLTIPNVTAQSIGLITLVSMLGGFFFEIPSGYVSDKIGHKQALILAKVLGLISTVLYLFADNLLLLIFGAVMLSIGVAFHSGTGSAFLHETLSGLKRAKDYARVSGKLSSIGFAVPIVLSTTIPFLVSIDYSLPFLIALVLDTAGVIVAMSLVTPKASQHEIEEIRKTNFWQVMKSGREMKVFSFLIFSGVLAAFLMSAGRFRAPYQVFLEVPVIWYGVFHGTGRILRLFCSRILGRFESGFRFLGFIGFSY